MKRMRLTTAGRVVIFILVAAILCGAAFFAYKYFAPKLIENFGSDNLVSQMNNGKTDKDTGASKVPAASTEKNKGKDEELVINVSYDEWCGYEPAVRANGGYTTQPGSIYDQLGIKVNIHIINDHEASSNALIKGDLDAAGYTLNRTAFLSGKFENAGLDIVMPMFTNYSDGGDGIIAQNGIESIEDLVDAKIGVPKFTESHSMVIWLVNKSDLSDDAKAKIIDNLILMDDAEQTGQAFFAGSLDVAATWQPYLSYAENSTDSHILFDTTSSNKLILSGVVFRKDFAEANPELVTKFIEGILIANEETDIDYDIIRSVMPMFSGMTDEEVADVCKDAGLVNYNQNVEILTTDCPVLYNDMCTIWESIGETVNRSIVDTLFDTSYIEPLADKYATLEQKEVFEVTEEQLEEIVDIPSMLTKTCTIEFHPDTAKFKNNAEAAAILDEFVEMAKLLDGTIIQIEGNVNYNGHIYSGDALSTSRAKAVKNYFVANGIDPDRIIVVGNGNSKMLVDPSLSTEETMPNRRTDIFFKTIGA